jgi:S1-C subfamily serine protease
VLIASVAGTVVLWGSAGYASAGTVPQHWNPAPGDVLIKEGLDYAQATSLGSGIVLTSSGEVLTNNHVIVGGVDIRVTDLDNDKTYAASVVGYDRSADLAVLQLIGATGLRTAALGDSAMVKVGDLVNFAGTVNGIASEMSDLPATIASLHRAIVVSGSNGDKTLAALIEFKGSLPTDVADAGGPILNGARQVIGVNTAIGKASNGFASEGYAIPIDAALEVAHMIAGGQNSSTIHVGPTPALGVVVNLAPCDCGHEGAAALVGVHVGSPAAKAGLVAGDSITSLSGHRLTSPGSLTTLLLEAKTGETVELGWVDVYGNVHSAEVRLASGPPQ